MDFEEEEEEDYDVEEDDVEEEDRSQDRCEPAQSKCTRTFHKSHFVWKFAGKMPYGKPMTPVLCEPAQAKWTWTCQKGHFVRKFSLGKIMINHQIWGYHRYPPSHS